MHQDGIDPTSTKVPLDRRGFLRIGALGGLAAMTAAEGCTSPDASVGGTGSASLPPFELEEVTVEALQSGMAEGRWTARGIAEQYLARIEALDRQGPTLRSVIETNPDALDIAEQLDKERRSGQVRGPLHGVPILVKDNLDTADRMTTTAGSLALEGSIPPRDAFVVERLRAAGAIILGKANLSEWANFRSTRSSSGWSARGGQCGNAYSVDRNPCGSSSGSAAAVSANFCALAIGTETSGSIVCPASVNGVVGVKPTVGLVSRSGIIPISHTQDTAGPMARTVRDAALLLNALTGEDPRDASTERSRGNTHADYTTFLDPEGLRGARIGVERSYFAQHPDVDAAMEQALALMSSRGAVIVDPANITTRVRSAELALQLMLWEFKTDLAAYLATLGPEAPVKTLADVIAFNERNADREMPFFKQELFLQSEAKGPLTSPEYLPLVEDARRLSRDEGIDAVMGQHQLDAIVAPSTRPAWKIDHVHGGLASGSSAAPAATATYPNVTVPVGMSFGLPFGISFFGRAWSEPTLLRLAYAFEQASKVRVAPGVVASLEASASR
jgi:amidase